MTTDAYRLYTDGGARGNPGPAGTGYVIFRGNERIAAGGSYIGTATNNQAEYRAVIEGLSKAHQLGIRSLDVYMDSELIVNQLLRKFKIKDPELGKLFIKAWNLMQQFTRVTFTHVPREENADADQMVNQAIDNGQ
ncbi:MAG: ribonuclease HI family protein [Patescibacteria group bacterium]